jgi:hypothetical protein
MNHLLSLYLAQAHPEIETPRLVSGYLSLSTLHQYTNVGIKFAVILEYMKKVLEVFETSEDKHLILPSY